MNMSKKITREGSFPKTKWVSFLFKIIEGRKFHEKQAIISDGLRLIGILKSRPSDHRRLQISLILSGLPPIHSPHPLELVERV